MNKMYQCMSCKARKVNPTDEELKKPCEKCGGMWEEITPNGDKVERVDIPEHILKDIKEVEGKAMELMNIFIQLSEGYFNAQQAVIDNRVKRANLQAKLKNTIENGMRKMKLLKRKEVKWGYSPTENQFIGLIKGETKPPEPTEEKK